MTVFKYILLVVLLLIFVYETVTLIRNIVSKAFTKKAKKVDPPIDETNK